jgi:hypothetical protein
MITIIERILLVICAVAMVGTAIALLVTIHENNSLRSSIDKARNETADLQRRLDQSERVCEIMKHQVEKTEQVVTQYSHAVGKEETISHEKLKEVSHDKTACDWLDAVLPDSIQLLYNTDSARRGEVCTEPAADDTFGTMPAAVSDSDENKP